MNPEEIFRMKRALAQRMALQRLLGGGDPGVGNPYPGTSQPFRMRYPTAMTDSGSYTAAQGIPGSQIGHVQPNPDVLYRLMQMFGQPRDQGQAMSSPDGMAPLNRFPQGASAPIENPQTGYDWRKDLMQL